MTTVTGEIHLGNPQIPVNTPVGQELVNTLERGETIEVTIDDHERTRSPISGNTYKLEYLGQYRGLMSNIEGPHVRLSAIPNLDYNSVTLPYRLVETTRLELPVDVSQSEGTTTSTNRSDATSTQVFESENQTASDTEVYTPDK